MQVGDFAKAQVVYLPGIGGWVRVKILAVKTVGADWAPRKVYTVEYASGETEDVSGQWVRPLFRDTLRRLLGWETPPPPPKLERDDFDIGTPDGLSRRRTKREAR